MSEGKRSLWPLLTAALIGLPVVYVASFGPAYWLASRNKLPLKRTCGWLYFPLNAIASNSPGALRSWANAFARPQANQFWAEAQNGWFDADLDVPFRSGSFDQ